MNATDRTNPPDASVLPPEAFVDTLKDRKGGQAPGDNGTIVRKLVPPPPR